MGFFDLFNRPSGRGAERARLSPTLPVPATTFAVSDVPPAVRSLPEITSRAAVECLLAPRPSLDERGRPLTIAEPTSAPLSVEACSRYRDRLLARVYVHPFLYAVHRAFADHRPLVLSPDMIWLLVLQGFAAHVNNHAETLRARFVKHQGKATIGIRRDDFVKGSPENPWEEVFSEFSAAVRSRIGPETHDLLLPTFSTTGEIERAAAEVALLDAMQRYFNFELTTLCGIPSITLEGSAEDWELLVTRARGLAMFELEWWVRVLVPVLEEFARAARGEVHRGFWRSLYKENEGSGGPFMTGWVPVFFPYLADAETGRASVQNSFLTAPTWGPWDTAEGEPLGDQWGRGGGPTFEEIPGGLSRAPFIWKYLWRSHRMEFLSGFIGVRQGVKTLGLRPEIGWAVREG